MTIQHRKPNHPIKRELKKRGISQDQCAFDLSLDRVAFNIWANGWEVPKPATRKKIADYFSMKETDLFPAA